MAVPSPAMTRRRSQNTWRGAKSASMSIWRSAAARRRYGPAILPTAMSTSMAATEAESKPVESNPIVLVAAVALIDAELGIGVHESCLAPFTFASHAYADFHLLMPLYVCRKWTGIVTAREGQRLKWVRPAQLTDYPMPPADKPLVAMLRDLL